MGKSWGWLCISTSSMSLSPWASCSSRLGHCRFWATNTPQGGEGDSLVTGPLDCSDSHLVSVHLPAHRLSEHLPVVAQELQSSWTSSLDFLAFEGIPKLISNILFLKWKGDARLQTLSSVVSASGVLLLCDWRLLGHDSTLTPWVMSCHCLTWSDSGLPLLSPIRSHSATICPWWWVWGAKKFVWSPQTEGPVWMITNISGLSGLPCLQLRNRERTIQDGDWTFVIRLSPDLPKGFFQRAKQPWFSHPWNMGGWERKVDWGRGHDWVSTS